MTNLPDDEGLFDDAFGEWLEAHGVELSPMLVGDKFVAHVDLNELKSAIMALISQRIKEARERDELEGKQEAWNRIWDAWLNTPDDEFDEFMREYNAELWPPEPDVTTKQDTKEE